MVPKQAKLSLVLSSDGVEPQLTVVAIDGVFKLNKLRISEGNNKDLNIRLKSLPKSRGVKKIKHPKGLEF